jgi:hypothetical protein
MSIFKVGERVRVAKIANDPYGAFTKAVLGKEGTVYDEAEHGYYMVDIEDEGHLVFRTVELEAV